MKAAIPEIAELSEVSARIGADPLLVQGPGGNTSFKSGDTIWIKASGVWLAEASTRPIFAGLSLPLARELVATGRSEDFSPACLPGTDPLLRPSIETALHVLMPQHAVVHAHAVASMTLSVLEAGPDLASDALDGLNWAWIPYTHPGAPLAAAIGRVLDRRTANILVLQNHGVVVGAETPAAAEVMLRDVERRLSWPVRSLPEPDTGSLSAHETGQYEALKSLSALAIDPGLLEIVTTNALFPDQVVFLGGAVPAVAPGEEVNGTAKRVAAASGIAPALVLWPGIGAFGARDRTAAASALIQGLFEVARRFPVGARVRGLSHDDATALLNWEAEAYRIKLARQRGI